MTISILMVILKGGFTKYGYSAKYKKYSSDSFDKEIRVVVSSIDKAIEAVRKAMKREEYSQKEILSLERGHSISAVERAPDAPQGASLSRRRLTLHQKLTFLHIIGSFSGQCFDLEQ